MTLPLPLIEQAQQRCPCARIYARRPRVREALGACELMLAARDAAAKRAAYRAMIEAMLADLRGR